ncbi:MAG: hypothetical protein IOC86_07445 [Aestuariivirga sp.]|nr:hypothetical protein [Aestuariivirga sp.]
METSKMIHGSDEQTESPQCEPKLSEADRLRSRLRDWLELKGLNANKAAKAAGVSVSVFYNFLNGDTASLSSRTLRKLAAAHDSTVDSILSGLPDKDVAIRPKVKIAYRVGALGSLFPCDDPLCVSALEDWSVLKGFSAALIEEGGLTPIPKGWMVFFKNDSSAPDSLIGRLAIVRFSGGGTRPAVRGIMMSPVHGLHSLKALDGSMTEDVKILAAHEIVSLAQAKYEVS